MQAPVRNSSGRGERPRCTTVLLVEQQTALRHLLKHFLETLPDYVVAGDATTQSEAEALCAQLSPEIAIVDIALAEVKPASFVDALRRRSPGTKILVFSAIVDAELVHDVIGAGVVGYVDKSADLETLRSAIANVVDGRQFFSPRVSIAMRELLQERITRTSPHLLGPREREVLREIAKGRFSKDIASQHGLSVFTVENIRRRIMRKTGLRSVAALTLHAVKLGLVPPPGRIDGREAADAAKA